MSFRDQFNSVVEKCIFDFIQKVSSEHSIPVESLISIWTNSTEPISSLSTPTSTLLALEPKKTTATKKKASANGPRCEAEITKRDKSKEICNGPVCSESKSGKYCSRHVKQENEKPAKQTTLKATPAVNKSSDLLPSSKEELKEKIEERKTTIQVRRNAFGNYEHYGSGIVLDKDTKEAYGKQRKDGSIEQLTKEDIELCISLGFAYRKPDNIKSSEIKKKVVVEEDEDDDEEDIDDVEDDMEDDE
jgi:hypothetical protein